MNDVPSEHRVVPFGNLRIKGHLHLPAAYRSLSRPSSPPRAKASAMRPCLLLGLHSLTTGIYFQLLQLLLCLFQHVIDRFPFYRKSENSGLEPRCQPIFRFLFLYILCKQFRRYKRLIAERFLSNHSFGSLSRKEVFQPHLPVRLPCYDLAPITSFTLGRSLRLRTSGTPGFHGLTGGVYKARERIHRAVADARLLANPASWSRVADSSPN